MHKVFLFNQMWAALRVLNLLPQWSDFVTTLMIRQIDDCMEEWLHEK